MPRSARVLLLALPLAACELPSDSSGQAGEAYDREAWQHWIDDDHDCQDTRTEVLIAEAIDEVEYTDSRRCKIASGTWRCPYTGALIRDPGRLDVDHVVALGNAHRSGGDTWTKQRRREYANDLDHPDHLVAVAREANRSKGAEGPETWLPPLAESRCDYVRDWVAIKARWQLRSSDAESRAIDDALAACDRGDVPALPQPGSATRSPANEEPASRECCKVCHAGKPCGDGCIAESQTCNRPPGCACDD
ncbi:GmrSD restriction endonuclease domain-containing protein [Nannocystaceae bacterium ST9]